MKKLALLVNYLTFLVIFTALMFSTLSSLHVLKVVLIFVAAVMLFRITSIYNGNSTFHRYNYLFIGVSVVYACFVYIIESPLIFNITFYLWVAALIGLVLSFAYKQPRVKRIKVTTKTTTKKVTKTVPVRKEQTKVASSAKKQPAKKVVKKAPVKKTTKKVATKKSVTKKVAKKSTTKKSVSKKSAKKSTSKKAGNKYPSNRYVAKRTMGKKAASKKVAKKTAKKSTKKTSTRRR